MRNAGTIMCTAAHVKVSRDGELTIKQIDVAFDCGSVANADAVRAQIEGGTIFGMNAAVNEQLTIRDGAIVEQNFDHYRSEEHTSELQSLMRISYAVFCLKKKKTSRQKQQHINIKMKHKQ